MNLGDFFEKNNIFKIKVIPNSQKTEIVGFLDENTLKLKSRGIPEKGKVNAEIIDFFAEYFNISKNDVKIISGKTARIKVIQVKK